MCVCVCAENGQCKLFSKIPLNLCKPRKRCKLQNLNSFHCDTMLLLLPCVFVWSFNFIFFFPPNKNKTFKLKVCCLFFFSHFFSLCVRISETSALSPCFHVRCRLCLVSFWLLREYKKYNAMPLKPLTNYFQYLLSIFCLSGTLYDLH